VEVERSDAFQAIDVARILLQQLLELVDRLIAVARIVRSVDSRHALLGVCSREIKTGHGKIGIQADGILKVLDRGIVLRAPIGLDALVELISRPEPVTSK